MELNQVYFYTATIKNWIRLLLLPEARTIVLGSLKYLVDQNKIKLYGFVIMPNHIHLLWEMLENNGKELPSASFMKYTSHEIQRHLRARHSSLLQKFKVDLETRSYQFWQRDPKAIHVYTPNVVYQKLDYIHDNPVQGKWMLADSPVDYEYSSAAYYETEQDPFNMLSHIGDRL